jgi:drug/metabolite transporter (DMT)-like permease
MYSVNLAGKELKTLSIASRTSSSSSSRHTFSWLLLILANILWATSYVASKYVLHETSLIIMLALRMGFSAVILLPFLIARRKELPLTRKVLLQLAVLSLIGFVFNKLFEYGGLALTTASDVALLICSESIFTAALSWIVLRERVKKITVAALLLGFVGVYLIIERSVIPTVPTGGGLLRIIGDLLVIMALVVEAFYTVRGKALLVKHSPLIITSASIVGSLLFWAPVAGWEILARGWHPISVIGWFSLGWLALMSTVIAYLAWFKGLAKIDGSAAASTLFIQPLLGTLLAIVFLQDQLTPMTIIGGVLIIISVYLLSRH